MDFFGDAQKMKQTAAVSWLWNESESELVGGQKVKVNQLWKESELVGGEKVKVSWLWKESESELVSGEKVKVSYLWKES